MENFIKDWCTVIVRDGYHDVITPSGKSIPALITTVTTDTVGEHSQCTLTIHCNIAKDFEDAINKYQKQIL